MDDTKRMLLAVVLTVGVMIVYTQFFAPKPEPAPETPVKQEQAAQTSANAPAPAGNTSAQSAAQPTQPAAQAPAAGGQDIAPAPAATETFIPVETPLMSLVFSTKGGGLQKITLKKYYQETEQKGGHYVLTDLAPEQTYSLATEVGGSGLRLSNAAWQTSTTSLDVTKPGSRQELVFTAKGGGLTVTKTYTIADDTYVVGLKVKVVNQSGKALDLTPEVGLSQSPSHHSSNSYAFTGLMAIKDNSLEEHAVGDLDDKPQFGGKIPWMSLNVPYFMTAVIPLGQEDGKRVVRGFDKDKEFMGSVMVNPPLHIANGAAAETEYLVYQGPRDLDILEPIGHDLARAVDFGWFDVIAKPMLAALKFLYSILGNYGVAIIIITILVKFLFWPLTAKSYKSMKRMQKLQPQIKKMREKYKDDKARMNQEMMQMYKTYKVNPMGGCLPMVVQIPVFIAFYKVLGSSIELRQAPFMFWINDLSAPDRIFPDLGLPWVGGIPVLTLLMGASMFFQQKMTPTTGDPTQAKMMLLMPVVFTFMFVNFPSGLVLYWLVNNLLSIGQQYYTNQKKD